MTTEKDSKKMEDDIYLDEDDLRAEEIVKKLLKDKETVVVVGWQMAEKVAMLLLKRDTEKLYAVDRKGRAYLFGLKANLYPDPLNLPHPKLTIEELYAPAIAEFIRVRRYSLSDEYDSLNFLIAASAEFEKRGLNPETICYERKDKYTLFYIED
jgi:hypothetical protein